MTVRLWWRFFDVPEIDDAEFDEALASAAFPEPVPSPPRKSITDNAAELATRMLESANAEIEECDARLGEYEERRQRAVLVREAYGPALGALVDGFDSLPTPKPRKRVVKRVRLQPNS